MFNEEKDIDLDGAVEKNLFITANTTLDFGLRYWLDEAKTQPDDLTGSTFEFTARDSSGTVVLALSTTAGEGITVDGQDLIFLKDKGQWTTGAGKYRYTLQRTATGKTYPVQYGDFIVKKNQN